MGLGGDFRTVDVLAASVQFLSLGIRSHRCGLVAHMNAALHELLHRGGDRGAVTVLGDAALGLLGHSVGGGGGGGVFRYGVARNGIFRLLLRIGNRVACFYILRDLHIGRDDLVANHGAILQLNGRLGDRSLAFFVCLIAGNRGGFLRNPVQVFLVRGSPRRADLRRSGFFLLGHFQRHVGRGRSVQRHRLCGFGACSRLGGRGRFRVFLLCIFEGIFRRLRLGFGMLGLGFMGDRGGILTADFLRRGHRLGTLGIGYVYRRFRTFVFGDRCIGCNLRCGGIAGVPGGAALGFRITPGFGRRCFRVGNTAAGCDGLGNDNHIAVCFLCRCRKQQIPGAQRERQQHRENPPHCVGPQRFFHTCHLLIPCAEVSSAPIDLLLTIVIVSYSMVISQCVTLGTF